MSTLTAGMLARMRAVQIEHMADSCKILTYNENFGTYGGMEPGYTEEAEIACGFNPTAAIEVLEEARVIVTSGALRLPIQVIDGRSRIKITKRNGEAVTEAIYDIVGEPLRGPTGLTLNLEIVNE